MFDTTELHPTADQRERNERIKPQADRCYLCGRPVKDWQDGPVWSVHLNGATGELFPVAEDHDTDPASQGWFTIGSECAKRIPAAYVSKPGK